MDEESTSEFNALLEFSNNLDMDDIEQRLQLAYQHIINVKQLELKTRSVIQFCAAVSSLFRSLKPCASILFTTAVKALVNFFALPVLKGDSIKVIYIQTLGVILLENGHLCSKELFTDLVNILLPLIDVKSSCNQNLKRLSINCLGNLCMKSECKGLRHYESIFNAIYINYLKYSENIKSKPQNIKILSAILRSIQLILPEEKSLYQSHIASLVDGLSKLMLYGTSFFPVLADYTEESESSGSEYSGNEGLFDRISTWKIRFHSLGCIQTLVKCASASNFVMYWSSFLAQSPSQPSLLSIMMTDPSHQVRTVACKLLSTMLEGQRSFLKVTNISPIRTTKSTLPYMPLSHKLSNVIREINACFVKVLEEETFISTKVQILKSLGSVSQQIPYDDDYETKERTLVLVLRCYSDPEPSIKKASLNCLASLLNQTSETLDETRKEEQFIRDSKMVETILTHFEVDRVLTMEYCKILASIALNHLTLIFEHFDTIFCFIKDITDNKQENQEIEPNTRLQAVKILENFTKALLDNKTLPPEDITNIWTQINQSHIPSLANDRYSPVRASICNMLSQMPNCVVGFIDAKYKIMVVTMVLGLCGDEAPVVRAQACRTLGVFILNKTLNVDPLFVSDAGVVLSKAVKDRNLNVRIRSAWSLANLCDSLSVIHENHSNDQDMEPKDIPTHILYIIAKAALHATRDNEKVRPNAVRALGNFLRFASKTLFSEDDTLDFYEKIARIIVKNTKEGSPKVRWNACYALSNIFHNPRVLSLSPTSLSSAIEALVNLLDTSKNYKIIIHALNALSIPSRDFYMGQFSVVCGSVANIIMNIETILDSGDNASLHYKEPLYHQACVTMAHIVNILTDTDLHDSSIMDQLKNVDIYKRLVSYIQNHHQDEIVHGNIRRAILKLEQFQ